MYHHDVVYRDPQGRSIYCFTVVRFITSIIKDEINKKLLFSMLLMEARVGSLIDDFFQ